MIAEEISMIAEASATGAGAAMSPTETLVELLAPYWLEICFLISFPIGYLFLNFDFTFRKSSGKAPKKQPASPRTSPAADQRNERLHRALEEDLAAGDAAKAVARWRKARSSVAGTPETLRLVVQAMAGLGVETLVDEVAAHMEAHAAKLCDARAVLAVLDAVGHGKHPELLDQLSSMCRDRLGVPMTFQWHEALLGGHAFAGNAARVDELCREVAEQGQKLTARGYALVIKGLLSKGLLDDALKHITAMRTQGFYVPPFAVALLFKVAAEAGRAQEMLDICADGGTALPEEAVATLFEDCFKRSDRAAADRIEALIRDSNQGSLPQAALEALLKFAVADGEPRALTLWAELVGSRVKLSDGFLVGILARAADGKYLRFAEEAAAWCRAQDRMTVALYSALMKVYAYCGMYDKACDLYPEICKKGLVPDGIMYGCLLRFAAECGRVELSKELAAAAPRLDAQHYVSLIRAAGRDRDAARAFQLLEQLEAAEPSVDTTIYNCVLDACVCAGELDRARRLVADMQTRFGKLDIITYNTLIKGITAAGDVRGARALLQEMATAGVKPNDITYNCIVHACGATGDFHQVWETVDAMQAAGIKADHYTLSIMLKALKRHGGQRELARVLALLDRSGIDVCAEEVLMNTLLETCTQLGETRRLQDLLTAYERSSMRPSLHLYGALIKAASSLKRLRTCRDLWREMTEQRGLEPNEIVLGCMLDALVCNRCVSDAVELLRRWKSKLGSNMVMISTLAKGFAAEGRAEEAMEMWREVRQEHLSLNSVVYNALIDAQARAGRTEEVATLFQAMKEDKVEADAITYSTMVKSHCVKGDMTRALEVLSEMQRLGLCKDCVVFNTVLDWSTRHNRPDVADRVLEDFEALKIAPTNFTVGILVKMYGRRRMLDKAFSVARTLPAKWNFQANAQVFTCLMSACFLNNSLSRALEVFEELKAIGVDAKSYGVVIGGCVRAGKLREAVSMVEDACGLNGRRRALPSWSELGADVLEPLLRSLAQQGQGETVAKPLITALRAAGVQLDFRCLTTASEDAARQQPGQRSGPRAGGRPERNWGSVRN